MSIRLRPHSVVPSQLVDDHRIDSTLTQLRRGLIPEVHSGKEQFALPPPRRQVIERQKQLFFAPFQEDPRRSGPIGEPLSNPLDLIIGFAVSLRASLLALEKGRPARDRQGRRVGQRDARDGLR